MPSSVSPVYSITTDSMVGMVLLDPDNPSEGAIEITYGRGRTEDMAMGVVTQQYATARYPEYSYSSSESTTLNLNLDIPFDADHDEKITLFESFVNRRKTIVYRDNRSRFVYGVILTYSKNYTRWGTNISATLAVTEYFQ